MAASNATAQQSLPDFKTVIQAVAEYAANLEDFERGDLFCQTHIAAALENVHKAGWEVPGADHIVKSGLADNSFLAKELSTPAGRKFMRKIARHPGAYSRLDQLSSIARGKTLVRDLIRKRDGDKLIEYLATTSGGHSMGSMLSGVQHGVDLNKPTGRIYTIDDLASVLKSAYAKQLEQRSASNRTEQ
jgi:hypothetical protein